jgi:acyl-CoA thioester hydrolase
VSDDAATFEWQLRVRFVDTDASGRIHYTAMFRYFEAAEFEFLRSLGVGYADIHGFTFPRVHADCDYLGPTKVDDLLSIRVSVSTGGRSSFTYSFAARSADGAEVARGKITVVCISRETWKPHSLPDVLVSAFTRALSPIAESSE